MTDASSLVNPQDYLAITGDAAAADTCKPALDEALGLIQDTIGRQLPRMTYTETLKIYNDGKVYPSATPIESVVSPQASGLLVQGAGIYVGYFDPTPAVVTGGWLGGVPPQVTLTYVGGFTAVTLPAKLRRAICRAAYNVLHPAVLSGVPGNVTSVQVGDVGYTGNGTLRTMDPLDDGIRKDINGYRNPRFNGWASLVSTAPAPA